MNETSEERTRVQHHLEFNINTAKRIISSFKIDCFEYPDATTQPSVTSATSSICERNGLVAECMLAIEKLQNNL